MRRSPLSRAAATLLSLLFLLAWGEPAALHPCPMHDGPRAASVAGVGHGDEASSAAVEAHAVGHASAHADGHAEHAAAPAPKASAHDGDHLCQCLGHGCCAAGVVLPQSQLARWQVLVARRAEPPASAPVAPPIVAAAHVLPFANGPPRLG